MSLMARPKKYTEDRKGLYRGWVCDSRDLQDALESQAEGMRQSLQMTITILLEEALKSRKAWPPAKKS